MKAILMACMGSALGAFAAPYRVVDVPLPTDRHQTSQVDGLAFTPGGRPVVCFPSGTVYIGNAEGSDWTLFAESLHTPLGVVALSESRLVVCQRPEVTLLEDTDGDGRADLYRTLTDDFGMSGNYHEFNFGPVRDNEGNLFFGLGTASNGDGIRDIVRGEFREAGRPGRMYSCVPYRGWVMKLTPDGEVVPHAMGFRTPNGLGFDAQERLYVSDNQGDWVGTSKLFHVEPGKFYGHVSSLVWKPGFEGDPLKVPLAELDALRTRAAILFPHGIMANSPTQPLLEDTGGAFSPFGGQLLVGEMNSARIMRCMLEEVQGQMQGACIPFLDGHGLTAGNNRLAFGPDHSLWVGHTRHTWAGGQGLQRIVRTDEPLFEVQDCQLTEDGFRITFTAPFDPDTLPAAADWKGERYFYEYRRNYGSPRSEVTPIEVAELRRRTDNRQIQLVIPELVRDRVYQFNLPEIKGHDGTPLRNRLLVYTLNELLPGSE